MTPRQRRAAIVEFARQNNMLTVEEMACRFAVSRETIRRDLAHLDAQGLLRRVHGGAQKSQTGAEAELSHRMNENADAKLRIALAAARLFQENDTLMIDAGSTTTFFAAELARNGSVTVITNSIAVANQLGGDPNHIQTPRRARVYLIGGEFNGDVGETLGSVALGQLETFRADHAVLTVGAIDASGSFLDFSVEEAMVARAMIKQSQTVTIIADHSKFHNLAMAKVCNFAEVSRLVTDLPPPNTLMSALRAAGVEVVVAAETTQARATEFG